MPEAQDEMRLVAGPFDAGLEPGSRLLAHERRALRQRRLGDADINRGVEVAREAVPALRALQRPPETDDMVGRHFHLVESGGATRGTALAHRRPIVDDLEAGRAARDERCDHMVLRIERIDGDPGGAERAGGIIFSPVQDVAARRARREPRGEMHAARRAAFRHRIADHLALQDLTREEGDLRLVAGKDDSPEGDEMRLRQLPDGGVGRGDQADDLAERFDRYVRTAVAPRHSDPQKPAAREIRKLRCGMDGTPVACGRIGRDASREGPCD
jgi:hypothetical protein